MAAADFMHKFASDFMQKFHPTPFQQNCFQGILNNPSTHIQSKAGTGKTLAYLLPLVSKYPSKISSSPNILVLSCSRELSCQVLKYTNAMGVKASILPFSPHLQDKKTVNVLSTTPIQLASYLSQSSLKSPKTKTRILDYLAETKYVVFDDCDTLINDKSSLFICQVIKKFINHKVFVTPIQSSAVDQFAEDSIKLTGSEEENADHVQSIRVEDNQKLDTLCHTIQSHNQNNKFKQILVFCNGFGVCNIVAETLKEAFGKDSHVYMAHGKMAVDERAQMIQDFSTPYSGMNILVCTDFVAKGFDFKFASLVISFDFPLTISDYMERLGRLNRLGSEYNGKYVNFVTPLELSSSSLIKF